MASKRISLAIMSEDFIVCSMYEGEYDKDGLKQAIKDATHGAYQIRPNRFPRLDTHVAVITFPIKLGGKTRVIKKFKLTRTD